MKVSIAEAELALAVVSPGAFSATQPTQRPQAGKVEIMKSSELKPGMKGYAWTVFQGTVPEAVPIEIIGLWKNQWGQRQDVILAKMGGKARALPPILPRI